jgi:acyl carrier protein
VTDSHVRLVQCFTAVFPELAADQIVRASTAGTSTWDSVNAVVLVSVIEEEFGLEIPPEDLDRFSSFQAILGYLVERVG